MTPSAAPAHDFFKLFFASIFAFHISRYSSFTILNPEKLRILTPVGFRLGILAMEKIVCDPGDVSRVDSLRFCNLTRKRLLQNESRIRPQELHQIVSIIESIDKENQGNFLGVQIDELRRLVDSRKSRISKEEAAESVESIVKVNSGIKTATVSTVKRTKLPSETFESDTTSADKLQTLLQQEKVAPIHLILFYHGSICVGGIFFVSQDLSQQEIDSQKRQQEEITSELVLLFASFQDL